MSELIHTPPVCSITKKPRVAKTLYRMSMIEDIDSSLISDTNDFLLHLEEHLSSQQPKKVDLVSVLV
jgi:hypothetical protein